MRNKNKEIKKLDMQLKNMPKPELTEKQKRHVRQTIEQRDRPTFFKKYTAILAGVAALFLFSFLIFTTINKNEQTAGHFSNKQEKDTLLENIIAEDGSEYMFEQIPWLSSEQELIEKELLPHTLEDSPSAIENNPWEKSFTQHNVAFSDLQIKATVNYTFFNDLFISGEYVLTADNEKELVEISEDLQTKLKEKYPRLTTGTSMYSEDSSHKGIHWLSEPSNYNSSELVIHPPVSNDGDYMLTIQVSAPTSDIKKIRNELIN